MGTVMSSDLHCAGDIVRIVYRQALSGFTVFEVRQVPPFLCPQVPGLFKAVYQSPAPLLVGARVELDGEWSPGKFGMQFMVASLSLVRRPSVEAALQYLQSGVVFGIGPALAKRIVSTFGVETMRILESDPERLLEVPGLERHTVEHSNAGVASPCRPCRILGRVITAWVDDRIGAAGLTTFWCAGGGMGPGGSVPSE